MSNAPGDARRGLLSATRNGVATLLSAGRTRLELLGNEIREEKLRAVRLLLLSQLVAFCLMVGTIVAVALCVIVFWDDRVLVLASFIGVFFVLGGAAALLLWHKLHQPSAIFAASIGELDEDLRQINSEGQGAAGTH